MKYIVAEQELEIPEGVTVDLKAREVVVKGKLGTLKKSFKHIPIEIRKEVSAKTKVPALKFRMWLQKKKRNAVLGTIRSTIRNLITGVSVGYKFKMVLAYSHFPIVVNVIENGKVMFMLYRLLKLRTSLDSK
jgi:large subunit ribosomal protein L9e